MTATPALNVTGLPAFSDNYLWLIDDGRSAIAVDPGDSRPILQNLQQRQLKLEGILVTLRVALGDTCNVLGADVAALLAAGKPSVPSRLADELATNPFLRYDAEPVIATARQRNDAPLHGSTYFRQ